MIKKFGVHWKYAMSSHTRLLSAPAIVLTATQKRIRFGASEWELYSKYAVIQSSKFLLCIAPGDFASFQANGDDEGIRVGDCDLR